MRVILAYPYDGHAPNDEIDVEDGAGRQLIRDGKARLAPSKPARPKPTAQTYPGPRPGDIPSPDAGASEGDTK